MILKIAIADTDVSYVEKITSVFSGGGYKDLNLFVYTSRKALEEALEVKQFDVLLFDASIYDGQAEHTRNMLSILLLDEEAGVPEACRSFKKIRKYQRISKIYQQILELYAEKCGDFGNMPGQGKGVSVAFYSPVGGVGKTTLALTAATRLARQGKRCFYFNMEDFASEDCYLPQNAERGISQIAACLGQEIHFPMKIQSLLQKKEENLFYLKHFDSPNDVYELSGQEIAELLGQMESSGLFDVIIVDMGVNIDGRALSIFEVAEKIVLIERADEIAVHKLNIFLKQAHICNEYGRKMSRVLNFDMGKGSRLNTDIPLIGSIKAAQNPEPGQFISILANGVGSNFALQLI